MVQELYQVLKPVPTPRCEAERTEPYLTDTAETDMQCRFKSRYKIDGKYLCTRHAGKAALQILLKEGE